MNSIRVMRLSAVVFVFLFFTACNSVPKPEDVSTDFTPQDIVLRAQQEFDKGNYKGAAAYYEIMRDRFPDDPAIQVQAEFEIGHILIKQKKWKHALEVLTPIIEKYEQPGSVLLPQKYYILAKADSERAKKALKK